MADKTKLSVIIPVYNMEQYLKKCLDSVVNQTLKDIEIICINDGSFDNSLKILEEYAKIDSRIRIISTENKGLCCARKLGFENVTSPYFTFADPDDWLELDCYEKAMTCFNENKDIDMVCFKSDTFVQDDNKKYVKTKNNWYNFSHNGLYDALNKDILLKTPRVVWNKIFKTDIARNNNLTFEKMLLDDVCFFYKYCLFSKKIYYANFIGYNYLTKRKGSIMYVARNIKKEKFIQDDFEVLVSMFDFCKKIGKIDEFILLEDIIFSLSQAIDISEISQVNNVKKYAKEYLKHIKNQIETKYTKLLKEDIYNALPNVKFPKFALGNSILGIMIYDKIPEILILYLFDKKFSFELNMGDKSE